RNREAWSADGPTSTPSTGRHAPAASFPRRYPTAPPRADRVSNGGGSSARRRSAGQRDLRLGDEIADDLASRLDVIDDAAGFTRPERRIVDVAVKVGGRNADRVARPFPNGARSHPPAADRRPFARPAPGRWPPRRLPFADRLVA